MKTFFVGILLILILCPLIFADLGFSKYYNVEDPIKLDLGYDEEVVTGRFINTGDESINLDLELVNGFEIAEIVDDTLVVPANGKERLKIRVSVPENTSYGDNYSIGIKYTEQGSEEGMIVITTSNTISFPILIEKVEIVPEEKEKGIRKNIIWIILGIFVVVVTVLVIKFFLKEKQTLPETVEEV